jgi:hypothetical protein
VGVERWFEREHSDLRGEAKNLLDRSRISVGAGAIRGAIRPRIAARGRIAAGSAASCAQWSPGLW